MARLCVNLPPFAPDYSGVCSALFDLNVLIAIHDAAGCTGNYTGFDEPRWFGSKKAIYCSGLREIDAILGNEPKFISRIADAAAEVKPELAAFVGSPVPMVMGTDFEGFALDLEQRIGVPSFGFATNGTEPYNAGVFLAGRALVDRFASSGANTLPKSVNILGATPLDISESNLRGLTDFLRANGYTVNANFFTGLTLEQVKNAGAAAVNIAVSQAGARLAAYLLEKFGTSYLVGLPFGGKNAEDFLARLAEVEITGQSAVHSAQSVGAANALIIGDEVTANALKNALIRDFGFAGVDVGAIFGTESGLYPDDIDLPSERAIADTMNSGRYELVIADPLICDLIRDGGVRRVHLPHYAVSSKIHANPDLRLIAENTNNMIGKVLHNV
ncbi:MAG: nitrogenase component 1 [Oscillospiraceae bacterium]|jgi:nitrogenase molybdenum-iron protein alpha/beta subunit|nr:nitrogenase component 1 [Oscillospiraceae bacterium]